MEGVYFISSTETRIIRRNLSMRIKKTHSFSLKITIFYKFWRKVIEHSRSKSDSGTQKFSSRFYIFCNSFFLFLHFSSYKLTSQHLFIKFLFFPLKINLTDWQIMTFSNAMWSYPARLCKVAVAVLLRSLCSLWFLSKVKVVLRIDWKGSFPWSIGEDSLIF